MNFAHPLALLLLPLIGLLLSLRVSLPRQAVGTGLFWQKALAEEKFRRNWQPWRARISRPLDMLIVALLVVAVSGPQIPASVRTVLIIDNSATMRATDGQPTRLDSARETARKLIDGLRWCDEMAVVTVCPAPLEIQTMTNDQALLKSAIDSIQATDERPEIDWAVKLAWKVFTPLMVSPRIVLITDAHSKEAVIKAQENAVTLAWENDVKVLRVGSASGNRAITGFNARRCKSDLAKCEVFVEVRNYSDQSAQGSLTVAIHDETGHLSSASGNGEVTPFSIVANDRWQHVFELDIPGAVRLTARIEPGDTYAFDDTASLDVPAPPTTGLIGPIGLASRSSPDIRVPGDIGSSASALAIEAAGRPLWIIPAAMAAVLLIIEWCLYQRRWTT